MDVTQFATFRNYHNYVYDRKNNRLFSGFNNDRETKPDKDGRFVLIKEGNRHRYTQDELLSLTASQVVKEVKPRGRYAKARHKAKL